MTPGSTVNNNAKYYLNIPSICCLQVNNNDSPFILGNTNEISSIPVQISVIGYKKSGLAYEQIISNNIVVFFDRLQSKNSLSVKEISINLDEKVTAQFTLSSPHKIEAIGDANNTTLAIELYKALIESMGGTTDIIVSGKPNAFIGAGLAVDIYPRAWSAIKKYDNTTEVKGAGSSYDLHAFSFFMINNSSSASSSSSSSSSSSTPERIKVFISHEGDTVVDDNRTLDAFNPNAHQQLDLQINSLSSLFSQFYSRK
ncbi:MAG: hypothetical protein LBB29_01030 [Holosporaceae bacterium]|jgi:hypothetical protein|nr:hypothetical protein [Holosporaceae bacterium]